MTDRGKILDELKWRGALNQLTDEDGLRKLTEEKAVSVYCGTDPTGDSLHVGHLIPFMILKRFSTSGPSSRDCHWWGHWLDWRSIRA